MDSKIENYIKINLDKGIKPNVIRNNLLSAGWKLEQIDKYFSQNKNNLTFLSSTSIINRLPKNTPSIVLRIGLAFVFMYAAIFVSHPSTGGKFVPSFVAQIVPIGPFLVVFGVFEAILAIWILTGKFRLISGLIGASLLIGITIFNLHQIGLVFRNVAIISAAIAFALL